MRLSKKRVSEIVFSNLMAIRVRETSCSERKRKQSNSAYLWSSFIEADRCDNKMEVIQLDKFILQNGVNPT